MNNMQMKPLSGKELDYIADSLSNENMLIKLCATARSVSANAQISQVIDQHLQVHEQHTHQMIEMLKQHQSMAPTQSH
ncbi:MULTISPECIES: hypothetical protein [unclassified Paenibacillus]|uniref:hypothetical protein n=1 Tax=unclassified Paenibacillus TaxID=185978 RepID=UPI000837CD03|nr:MULTISPECIES: hypothetical protein [unclassified Paenibacillus]NWL88325.1 hypothetical protein [Paenibacillus sp. 79R4]